MVIHEAFARRSIEAATDAVRLLEQTLDAHGKYRRSDEPRFDPDEVLAWQLELALGDVDGDDVEALVQLLERVVDPPFSRSFAVVKNALERAQGMASKAEAQVSASKRPKP